MKDRKSRISVKLVGGIGNQLFCYFAGYDLAIRTKSVLELDVTDIRSGVSAHPTSIESLSLPGHFVSAKSNHFFHKLRWKNNLVRVSRRFNFSDQLPRRILVSKEIGFDAKVLDASQGSSLFGYFQTYLHFFPYKRTFSEISLRNPSNWYKENLLQMKSGVVVAVHVRRGDYSNLANTYGLLSSDYYKRAVDAINIHLPDSIFWVFSDDPDSARILLVDVLPTTTIWVKPPPDHDATETMLLMSNALGNITANSTFSWWGAALNSNGGPVIAPSKWFRSMLDPKDLYPPHWILVESSWVK